MKGSEMLTMLVNRGVITTIGNEYFLTDRLNKLDADDDLKSNLLVMEEPEKASNMDLYPKEIRESGINKKVKAILDYCKVPGVINRNGSRFLVRSSDKFSSKALLNIVLDPAYKPEIVLKVIRDYYETIDYPKAFKRFVLEGDLISLYDDFVNGGSLDAPEKPDNQVWG
jgi:hypothetical protein